MDVRRYVNDGVSLTLRPRAIWRIVLPGATVWAVYTTVTFRSQWWAGLIFAGIFGLWSFFAWTWRVRIVGRVLNIHRPPFPTDGVNLSTVADERVEWDVTFARLPNRVLLLERADGSRLFLSMLWWSNWRLVCALAHEWRMRGGRPYG